MFLYPNNGTRMTTHGRCCRCLH